jgi:hypothetical protein
MGKLRNRYLAKVAKKAGLSIEGATKIIVYQYELDNLVPKELLKKVNFNMDIESAKAIKKVSKALKVSDDAVVGSALVAYLEEEEKKKAYAKYDKQLADENK